MITEKIKQLIQVSNINQMQKNIAIGFIDKCENIENEKSNDRILIEQVANEKKLFKIIFSNDEVKIYTVKSKEEWDIKYPYRIIFLNDKKVWERISIVSPSLYIAFLVYLSEKHLGSNSNFVEFAAKMLKIKIDD